MSGKPKSAQHRVVERLQRATPWAIAESLITAFATLLSTVVVARLLSPADFGIAAISLSVTALLNAFFGNALQQSLVRMPSAHGRAQDTGFTLLTIIGILCALVCWPIGWWLAQLYGVPELFALVGVGGIDCLVLALEGLPAAMLTRKLRTRTFMLRTLSYRLVSVVITVALAVAGAGPWSILLGILGGDVFGAFSLWRSQARRPRVMVDRAVARELVGVALWICSEQGIATLTVRGFVLAFGKLHGLYWLGMLNFSVRLVDEVVNLLISSINRVSAAFFAAVYRIEGDLGETFAMATKVILLVSAPLLVGLAAVAPDLIPLVFGPKWIPAIPGLQIIAMASCARLARVLSPVVLRTIGYQSPGTINAVIALLASAIALWLTRDASLPAAMSSYAVRILVTLPLGFTLLARFGGVSVVGQQLKPLLVPAMATLSMAWLIADLLLFGGFAGWTKLVVEIAVGAAYYAAFVGLFERSLIRTALSYRASGRAGNGTPG